MGVRRRRRRRRMKRRGRGRRKRRIERMGEDSLLLKILEVRGAGALGAGCLSHCLSRTG